MQPPLPADDIAALDTELSNKIHHEPAAPDSHIGTSRPSAPEALNPGNNLYVAGISNSIDDRQLEEIFSKYGTVTKSSIVKDPNTQDSRGFGFVTMDSNEAADAAIANLNGLELAGKTLLVEKARRKRPRTPTPGEYYGEKKDRRRSDSRYRGSGSRRDDDRYGSRRDRRDYSPPPRRDYGDRYDDRRRYEDRRPQYDYPPTSQHHQPSSSYPYYDSRGQYRGPTQQLPPPPMDYGRGGYPQAQMPPPTGAPYYSNMTQYSYSAPPPPVAGPPPPQEGRYDQYRGGR